MSACVPTAAHVTCEGSARAKALVEQEYRRRGEDIVTAFNDAHEGTNGGMRTILDIMADGLKAESVEDHTRDVFDRYVAPNSWEQKVNIIQQFIQHCGMLLSSSFVLTNRSVMPTTTWI